MNYEEFLEALREKGGEWALFPSKGRSWVRELRTLDGHCPLSFVAGTERCNVAKAVAKLGITDEVTMDAIVFAADGESESKVRRDLLEACGLTEEVA